VRRRKSQIPGEDTLNKSKQSAILKSGSEKPLAIRPGAFVFCERGSGAMRFQVNATPDGTMPLEWTAGLLAMHCVIRGEKPSDYTVLVVPEGNLLDPVRRRAHQLIAATRTTMEHRVRLTPRERQVLKCVLEHKSNKEIGSQLHLTERTARFHVSALLAKFKARDRRDLMHKAAAGLLPVEAMPPETLFGFPPKSSVVKETPIAQVGK
jgi:DNA-binding CsgD family transcriptional regulator